MAEGPRIPHWLTLTIRGTEGNENWANVLAYKTTPDVQSPSQLAELAQNFATTVLPVFKAALSNTVYITDLFLRTNYPNMTNYEVDYPLTPQVQGTVAADREADNVAGVVSWRSGAVGRSYRGRSYIPGVPEGDANGPIPDATQLSRWAALAAAIATWVGTSSIVTQFSVASRSKLALIQVITALIDTILKSQRTRLPGAKKHKRPRTIP